MCSYAKFALDKIGYNIIINSYIFCLFQGGKMKKIVIIIILFLFICMTVFSQEIPDFTEYEFNISFDISLEEFLNKYSEQIKEVEIQQNNIEQFIEENSKIFRISLFDQNMNVYFMFFEEKLYSYEIQYDKYLPLNTNKEKNSKCSITIINNYLKKYGIYRFAFMQSNLISAVGFTENDINIYIIDIYFDNKYRIIYTKNILDDKIRNIEEK